MQIHCSVIIPVCYIYKPTHQRNYNLFSDVEYIFQIVTYKLTWKRDTWRITFSTSKKWLTCIATPNRYGRFIFSNIFYDFGSFISGLGTNNCSNVYMFIPQLSLSLQLWTCLIYRQSEVIGRILTILICIDYRAQ